MNKEYAGHYSIKHPQGASPDPLLAAALKEKAKAGRVTCAEAYKLSEALGVSPSEVGKTADLLELRITECQLGLFGYAPQNKVVKAATRIPDELRTRLQQAARNGTISCASCWEIAETLAIEKMAVSAGCELLGLKIVDCQLGAF